VTAQALAADIIDGASAHGGAVFVFAHGILGNRANWKGFARRLCEARPEVRAVVVDLRRHGESHGDGYVAAEDTVRGAARDLAHTLRVLNVTPRALVGHSWGGKAVLSLGLGDAIAPPTGLEHVVVIDSPPGLRAGLDGGADQSASGVDDVERVVAVVTSLPPGLARDRAQLVEDLRARGLSESIARWMTTNLQALPQPTPDGGVFRFKFDADGVRRMLADFVATDLWPALMAHTAPPHVHMIRGGRSNRWTARERSALAEAVARGACTDLVLEAAGHWVHTDDPNGVLAALVPLVDG